MNRSKGDGSNLNPDETAYNCAICTRPDHEDDHMVYCEGCTKWFHFSCAGVGSAVEYDENWRCSSCCEKEPDDSDSEDDVDDDDVIPVDDSVDGQSKAKEAKVSAKSNPDDEKEIAKAMEAVKKQKERLKRKMEQKLALAKAQMELENEEMEMQWALEKQILQMKIASEKKFQKKKEMEKKQLQKELEELSEGRKQAEKEVEKLEKKKKRESSKGTKSSGGKLRVSSTPIVDPKPSTSTEGMKKKTTKVKSVPVVKKPAKEEEEDESDSDDDGSKVSSQDEQSDDSNEDSSRTCSEDEEEDKDLKKSKRKNKQDEENPTKAQISARQFLSRKLPTFTGRPDEWPIFISSYNTTTKACGFSNLENLARLQESLRGPAREAVCSRMLLPEAVPQIIETLRMLYGRPEQLLNTLLVKVRKADCPKADRLGTFISFGMVVQQLCDHLEATKLNDHLVNPLLIQELVEKLPPGTKMDWVRFKRQHERVTLRTLADFLSELVSTASEVTGIVDMPSNPTGNRSGKAKGGRAKENESHINSHSEESFAERKPCPTCGGTDHRLRNCDEFRKMGVQQRLEVVERFDLCRSCLNAHGRSRCKANIRCKVDRCQGQHNTMLHQQVTEMRSDCNAHSVSLQLPILFRMIPVTLSFGEKSINIMAFLDEGSSFSLVESSITNQLKATGKPQPLRVTWTAGMTRLERESMLLNLTISAVGSKEQFPMEKVHTVKELKLPAQSLNYQELVQRYSHLRNLPVAEYPNDSPKILVGLKHLHLFAPIESRIGQAGEPIAVRSSLGWTVYGPQEGGSLRTAYVGHHSCAGVSNQELHDLLKSHYVLEEAGVSVEVLPESAEDQRAREILERTTKRVGDRFETGLLWKEDDPSFPDSYPMAARRMKSLDKRLSQSPQLQQNVRNQLIEYQSKGYCHKATVGELNETDPKKVWYLPLNIVINPKKPNKVRLVWDAASAVGGVSLNSKLLKGPDFLTSLPSVVCKFRQYSVGFGGDIREMFHQLKIRLEDRQALRFMFDGEVYVMDCAIFGATCSPSQALFVKDRNASEFMLQFPDAVDAIVNRHYVDDYFDSTETVEEAVKKATEVRYIHSKGGFEIRNWVSNSSELLQQLGESKSNQIVHFNTDKATGSERVLGIVWDPQEDVFTFALQLRENLQPYLSGDERPTKRIVLSIVMSLFDPLGLLTMFTIHGKMLIQDLWRTGCEWDESIDDESFEKWQRWTALLPDIERVKIPRHYFGGGESLDYESLQLHVFVDASAGAYGCVAYLRMLVDGIPRCTLVQARSKVAPLRQYSTPRLELMAAVLGAKMAETVKKNHSLRINRVQFWTDSSTVYSWIVSDHRKYKVFVAYRIGEILSKTNPSDWRWIRTKLNIADDLTKWKEGTRITSNSPWFMGPKFLYETEDTWPHPEPPRPNVKEELRASLLFHSIEIARPLINCSRISKWNIVVRTVANVLRFVSNIRRKQRGLPIESLPADPRVVRLGRGSVSAVERPFSREEYQEAERHLWKMAQGESFADEVKTLARCREGKYEAIDRSSDIFKLSPILDEHNVMRMDGRVQEGEFVPFELQFPVILPKGHPVTVKLIEHYHQLFGHANRETVVNELRQRFYIPGVRRELERVAKSCMRCKVQKCKPVIPRMAPLPNQRTTPFVRPFSYTGVDFFGPINVVVGRHTEKRWCALFTCLGTRAIHLEVVHSLSSQACLMAIRRFVCRRGVPIEYFSDNGTNFVGASKEIVKEIKANCSEELTSSRTRWNFNPPSAPHFGGVWERLVRSVKEAVKVLDDGRKLTDEILQTTLAEAEDMVNSRPLTYIPQEPGNTGSITPNHFLRGLSSGEMGGCVLPTNEAEALRDSYKRSQMLADRIWKRWLAEYLPFINRRSKWHSEQNPLEVGEVVFVADDDNRKCWVRAVVEEVIQGADGRIRQAVVRTAKGTYRRPVAKLAVPEIRVSKSGSSGEPTPVLRGGAVEAPVTSSPNAQLPTHAQSSGVPECG
ncbi:uncharacterized protein LOC135698602 [Ochlerotatus camptorhynchus]|uniref:uncharacterized protein LOC135698602 n=1 Tax=Ochlerotatus camptorhynchus TaxID=644619 RepID=UPI0031D4FA27